MEGFYVFQLSSPPLKTMFSSTRAILLKASSRTSLESCNLSTTSLIIFLTFLLSVNYIVDPFGVFGDKFFKWDTYNIVNNQRIGKIDYLDKISKEYEYGNQKA